MQDPMIEAMLTGEGVVWKYLTKEDAFPLDAIDMKMSLENHARLKPIIPDNLSSLRQAIRQGADLPAVLLWKVTGSKKYVVVRGIHRVTAFREEGYTALPDVYIFESTDHELVWRWVRAGNVDGGERSPEPERLANAAAYVHEWGASQARAAEVFMVTTDRLGDYISTEAAFNRLIALGVKGTETLVRSTIRRIGSIRSDVAVRAVLQLVLEAELSGGLLEELITAVNRAQRSEHDQLAVVQEWRDRADIRLRSDQRRARRQASGGKKLTGRMHLPAGVAEKFRRELRQLRSLMLNYPTMPLLGITTVEQAQEVKAEWKELMELGLKMGLAKPR